MIFKRRSNNNIYAPIAGLCLDISACEDAAFSEKAMGDGFLIVTEENVVCSPCDGVLSMIFPSKHAFGIKKADGEEILVHIGVDTVELNGEHFEQLCTKKQKIKRGTPVIRFENKKIQEKGYNTDVLVIVTDHSCIEKKHLHEEITVEDIIVERG